MKAESELRILDDGNGQPATADRTNTTATSTGAKSKSKPPKKPEARSLPTQVLPSDRVSFQKQLDMLRAYAAASGPGNNAVTIEEIASVAKVADSTIKMLNGFFCGIGLILRTDPKGGKFQPSAEVMSFAKNHEWNAETAPHKLAPIMAAAWFADPLLKKVSFSPITEKEALATLAEKAGAGPEYESQLHVILEFLHASGLIRLENGSVQAVKQRGVIPAPSAAAAEHDSGGGSGSGGGQPPKQTTISTAFSQAAQGVVNFHVDVKVNMSDFAGWSPDRISSFFAGIAQVLAAKGAIEKEASKENT